MAVSAPPPTRPAPDAGVIDDARALQRRRRGRATAALLAAVAAGAAVLAFGGSGGGNHRAAHTSRGPSPYVSVGSGIDVRYPRGWHLLRPPITSLAYPYDRMLLTSYPARRGGECGPARAEHSMPAAGALVYVFEYTAAPTSPLGQPTGTTFPPQAAGFKLSRSEFANWECSARASYLIRFMAAGRLFQATIAFGPHAPAARRAQVIEILNQLKIRPQAGRD
jgi:hypothetical protein